LDQASMKWRIVLDRTAPFTAGRWIGTGVCLIIYAYRVFHLTGWYIVTYALGIYLLNLMIGFLSPVMDPEAEGPALPTAVDDTEFKPFVRRLPEFKFWYSATRALLFAFVATFFQVFNIPVFWPILLFYFIALFCMTMKRQIMHMIQHKYIPFSFGKKQYKATNKEQAMDPSKDPAGKGAE